MEKERIQKILSAKGICSRRKAEELLLLGKVKVNGVLITEPGFKCYETDDIEVDGLRIHNENKAKKYIYLKMNKPNDVVTTVNDPQGRKTVMDFVPSEYGRLYPVGRLDHNSTGLLIMTNDGEFANLVTHPSTSPEKEYIVTGKHSLRGDEIRRLEEGLYVIKEGYRAKPAISKVIEANIDSITLSITIHEGKKREIRHMMETLGHPVISLERVRIGNIFLNDLAPGEVKEIPADLITSLKKQCRNRKENAPSQ